MIREFMEKTVSKFISIPTLSGNEKGRADFVFNSLKESGLNPERDEYDNVWVEVGSGDKVLHVNGHLDSVVPVDGWVSDPHTPRLDGDNLHGLGSTDCGAGLAAMLWLAPRVEPKVRVIFSWTVCEEGCDHNKPNGSTIMAARGGDWAITCEPSCTAEGVGISLGTQGHARAFVTFPGKAAHSSRPDLGDNAIYKASRFSLEIEKLNESFKDITVYEAISARPSVAVTLIDGGKLNNIIPDSCTVTVSRRLGPGETPADFEAEVAQLTEGQDVKTRFACDGPCAQVDVNGPLFAAAKAGCEELFGKPTFTWQRGRTDAVIYAGAGMDTLTIGPGLIGQSHVANEHVNLDAAAKCVGLLEGVINTIE